MDKQKEARKAALRILAGHTIGTVSPVGKLKTLGSKEKDEMKKGTKGY